MMPINKNEEPKGLKHFKKQMKIKGQLNKKAYDKFREERYDDFKSLQKSLWEEQYGLCCYCMRKIELDKNENSNIPLMTVEHFKPKSKYPCLSLTYSNLLACCDGKLSDIKYCCGKLKENKELKIIPNPSFTKDFKDFARKIKFKNCGKIDIDDSLPLDPQEKKDLLSEIIDFLNLNDKDLVKRRKEAFDHMIESFKKNKGNRDRKSFFDEWCRKKGYRNRIEYHAFIEYLFLKEATNS